MATTTAVDRDYSIPAKLLHWVIAACVIFIIPAGIVMVNLDSGPLQNQLFNLHRSFGALVLALMAVRVGYRLTAGAPPASGVLTPAQYVISRIVHTGLYLLLIAQPIIGWVGTSAYPATISFFGLFDLPALVGKDRALSETLLAVHGYLGFLIAAMVVLHIAAALYHGLVRRDGVLSRML